MYSILRETILLNLVLQKGNLVSALCVFQMSTTLC